ncbi:hypothetical protein DM860_016189 [Cuscuta australis]|uniref:Inositol polyphosphate-related phosphatase domain-containing protein n=1 Tax=Cuscuta australis TaxID=267555 RepID=A0A328DU00_9ASTE|nr:hypothetical protein DM860_016189 [Cuscuta australis]
MDKRFGEDDLNVLAGLTNARPRLKSHSYSQQLRTNTGIHHKQHHQLRKLSLDGDHISTNIVNIQNGSYDNSEEEDDGSFYPYSTPVHGSDPHDYDNLIDGLDRCSPTADGFQEFQNKNYMPEVIGAGGGIGIFKVPSRSVVHPGRPPCLELRPHPLRETQAGKYLRTIACTETQLWAGQESGVRVWNFSEAYGAGVGVGGRVRRGDEDAAPFNESVVTSPSLCLMVDLGSKLVWSGHKDGKIRSWKIDHCNSEDLPFKEGLSWQAHRGQVLSLVTSSYGDIWSGSEGGVIKVWPWEGVEKSLSLSSEEKHMAALLAERSGVDLRNQVTVNGVCNISSSEVKCLLSDHIRAKVWAAGSLSFSLWDARTRELLKVYNVDGQIEIRTDMPLTQDQAVEDEMNAKLVPKSKKEKTGFLQRSRNALIGAADAVRRVASKGAGAFVEDAKKTEALVIAPDGIIWTGCSTGLLVQWDGNGSRVQDFLHHPCAVICFCTHGSQIWVGYVSGMLQVLDLEGNVIASWVAHNGPIVKLAVGNGYVFSLANHGGIRGWNLASPGPIDNIMRQELTRKEETYRKLTNVQILIGTWNVGQGRASQEALNAWLGTAISDVGIVVVGLQEVEMGAGFLAMSAAKETKYLLFVAAFPVARETLVIVRESTTFPLKSAGALPKACGYSPFKPLVPKTFSPGLPEATIWHRQNQERILDSGCHCRLLSKRDALVRFIEEQCEGNTIAFTIRGQLRVATEILLSSRRKLLVGLKKLKRLAAKELGCHIINSRTLNFRCRTLNFRCCLFGINDLEVGLEGSSIGQWWQDAMGKVLGEGSVFERVGSRQLAALLITIWVRKTLRAHVGDLDVGAVACGLGRAIGNKGGVGLRLRVFDRLMCFLNCHFAAHMEAVNRRNADFCHIFRTMTFSRSTVFNAAASISSAAQVLRGTNVWVAALNPEEGKSDLAEADMVIFFGDFNYRLFGITYDEGRDLVSHRSFDWLREKDQLRAEMKAGKVFQGMREAIIRFPPTYKFEKGKPGLGGYDSGEKKRIPAWCDRVLYRDSQATPTAECSLECPVVGSVVQYEAIMEVTESDHKPVRCKLNVEIAHVDRSTRRKEFGNIYQQNENIRAYLEESRNVPDTSVGTDTIVLHNLDAFSLAITNRSEKDKAFFQILCKGQSLSSLRVEDEPSDYRPRGSMGFPRWLEVTPAAGMVKPDQCMEVLVRQDDFQTSEEFTDEGIPQSWWSEDNKDKEVVLLVNVVGSHSTETITHQVHVQHRYSPNNSMQL